MALVAEVDGHVAGYLEASILEASESARWQWSTDARTTRLFIGALACDPAHRRQGVATALVKAAEVWGRARGAVVAVTETWARSPWSMPFWETGMGYRPKNVMLRKPLEPLS